MPIQVKEIQVVLAKIEATEGTDPTPAAGDAIQLMDDATLTYGAEQNNPRPGLANQLLDEAAPLAPAAKYAELQLKFYVRGSGTSYTAGISFEGDAIMQAAGFSATFTTNKWDYDTVSTGLKTVTLYCWQGVNTGVAPVLHKITAARVSKLEFTGEAGQPGIITATIRGLYNAPTDAAMTTPTYKTSVPPLTAMAASFSYAGAATYVVRKFSVSIDNTLTSRKNVNVADALAGYLITHRKMTWSVTMEAGLVADYNPVAGWIAGTAAVLALAWGSAAYNKLSLTADKAVIADPPKYGDDGGVRTWDLGGTISPEGTNRLKVTTD
jgi:hypothetical protein